MSNRFYLPGLDGLRAIASLSVVVGHIELTKKNNGLPNFFDNVSLWGSLGVVLFFVLSGFLITTLLFREKDKNGRINIKHFYMRRILRVWPLYYIILILSALIFWYSPNWLALVLCGTIFPNFAHAFAGGWMVSPQIWSIGVEEQFYLFWPTIAKQKERIVLIFTLFLAVIFPFIPHALQFIMARMGYSASSLHTVEKLFEVLNFGAMATGALFSILYFRKYNFFIKLLALLKPFNWFFILLPFGLWFGGIDFSYFHYPIYAFLFGYMIILIVEGNFLKFFESKVLKFLGEISYGTYMYHWIIMLLFLEVFKESMSEGWLGSVGMYACTILGTILVAYLSHRYLESFFLRLKKKFN